jgi:hypothetical protein
MIKTTCAGISDKWEVYTAYAAAAGMLLHINGKFTMGQSKSSILCEVLFVTISNT